MSRLIRLSQDKTQAIVQKEGLFSMIDVKSRQCLGVADSLSKFDSQNVWNYPSSSEKAILLPVVAAGMSSGHRRQKANSQPRDNQGRWVSAGANVRWRSNGQEWAGTVDEIINGKAIVTVRHPDGTESRTTLLPSTIRVMASKARLSSASTQKYYDNWNDTSGFIGENREAIEKSAEEEGGASIEREDGYALDVKQKKPKESNPLVYQLYAPGGLSLGIFDEKAEKDFNDIIEDDKAGGEDAPDPAPSEGGEAPAESAPAPASGVSVVASGNLTPYSVPKAVQTAVLAYMEKNYDEMSSTDITRATELCSGDQVGIESVQWVDAFFESLRDLIDLYGGHSGGRWAEKVTAKYDAGETSEYEPIDHDFETGLYQYYATGNEFDEFFDTLIAVDFDMESVHVWDGQRFGESICSVEEFDALNIEPLDESTAREIAYGIHEQIVEAGKQAKFSLNDVFPEERNLFALAESEIDFATIDDLAQLAYDGYDRSRNATGQARAEGGKFGSVPESPTKPKTDKAPVDDTAKAVEEAGAKEEVSAEEDPLATAEYFAIVDEIDQSAVLDIVAISNEGGQPTAYKRIMGAWTPDAESLASLKGATPPAIVNLGDVEEIKDVLSQVDEYDGTKEAVTASAIRRGYSLPDGSYRIFNEVDLIDALNAVDQFAVAPQEAVAHISKRAKALNRVDTLPEEWRVTSMTASGDVLYGEFGEVIVASGDSFAPNLTKLESYFTAGHGSKKIRWGTDGDITRAQSVFARYIGVERAYGLAQVLKNKVTVNENP